VNDFFKLYQKYFKTQYIDFESLMAIPNILLNPYLKLSAYIFDMIFQSQGFGKSKNLISFSDNEAFKEENLDLDLVQISNHPFALLSGRIEIQYPNC